MTEPSKKALDYAARKAGYDKYVDVSYPLGHSTTNSIIAHAETLDELWAIKPPKTRGELFAEEMYKRWKNSDGDACYHLAQMIDEGWEPEDE